MGTHGLRIVAAGLMLFGYVMAVVTFTPLGCSVHAMTDVACTSSILACQNCTSDLYKLLIASYMLNETKDSQDEHIDNLKTSVRKMKKTNQYLGKFVPAMEFVLSLNDSEPPPRFEAETLTKILEDMPFRKYSRPDVGEQKKRTAMALGEEAKIKQVRSWAQLREIRNLEEKYMSSIKKMNISEALSFYIFMRSYNMSIRNEIIGTQAEILRARAIWPGAIAK